MSRDISVAVLRFCLRSNSSNDHGHGNCGGGHDGTTGTRDCDGIGARRGAWIGWPGCGLRPAATHRCADQSCDQQQTRQCQLSSPRDGNPKNSRDATTIAGPPIAMPRGGCWLRVTEYPLAAVGAALVLTMSAAAPMIAGGPVTEHVGCTGSLRARNGTAQGHASGETSARADRNGRCVAWPRRRDGDCCTT
jgi:hypothetical protein